MSSSRSAQTCAPRFSYFKTRRLCWLGHVHRLSECHSPGVGKLRPAKGILCGPQGNHTYMHISSLCCSNFID